ncbi:proline-rich protein 2-like [Schistocerca serialis cubense]|uniref:proline-rich protein 2-like n=1 Tax=Schistocerca serialis cubense TaxID=2023355 RepID=UPI00214EFA94|nr:proline-rich protein 2-like [Schistocerca serialis cubense]
MVASASIKTSQAAEHAREMRPNHRAPVSWYGGTPSASDATYSGRSVCNGLNSLSAPSGVEDDIVSACYSQETPPGTPTGGPEPTGPPGTPTGGPQTTGPPGPPTIGGPEPTGPPGTPTGGPQTTSPPGPPPTDGPGPTATTGVNTPYPDPTWSIWFHL